LQDVYTHLTNNSITKDFQKHGLTEVFDGNMMSEDGFKVWLKSINKENEFQGIKERLHELVILTQLAGKKNVSNRKGSFCVFGYDFMIDEDMNVWLIEVNTSPSMDLSTKVTQRLVPEFQRDIVRWVVDYNVFGKRELGADVGKLKRVYKEKKLSTQERLAARFSKK
jgi:tubulin monoglycylase TTLL3/8